MALTRVYRNGVLEAENFPVAKVSDYLADPATVVWFDLCEPTAADLESIKEELGLHELAVEDALEDHERPKLDRYKTHLFVAAYSVALDTPTGELTAHEVAAFITHDAMVTVRKDRGFDIGDVLSRWDNTNVGEVTCGFLLYGLLDHVVDTHFDAVQALDNEVEALEDQLFDDHPRDKDVQRRTFALRKSLVKLRRLALPMREVVNSLMRRDVDLVDPKLLPYYQDLYDHVLRVIEWTESLREMITAILETQLTARGNRLGVITKQVTSWAAIIAVPTAVTGFYGQNVPYPGFGRVAGFWTSTVIILGLACTLYVIFRRKEWL